MGDIIARGMAGANTEQLAAIARPSGATEGQVLTVQSDGSAAYADASGGNIAPGSIGLTEMSQEAKDAFNGTGTIPPDGSVTLAKTDFIVPGKNLFDKSTITAGQYVNWTNGNLSANSGFSASDYIKVSASTEYSRKYSSNIAYYNSSKVFLSGTQVSGTQFTTPENCTYIRISISNSDVNAEQVELGGTSTTYEAFYHTLDSTKLQLKWGSITYAMMAAGVIPNLSQAYYELTLPPKIYCVVGKEINIYFDNLVWDKASNYIVDVACDVGVHQDERWTYTPVAAGTNAITISFYDKYLNLVKSVVSSVVAVAANAQTGVSKTCLFIGDSTTAPGVYTNELLTLMGTDVMDISLIGTQGSDGNLHEGYSGKTVTWHYSDVASPFVFDAAFNFSTYMSTHSFAGVDYVFIHLGINDAFGYTTDTGIDGVFAANLIKLEAMIASMKTFNASVKIGMMITIPPSYHQDAFGKDYYCGMPQYRYKRNVHRYCKKLIDAYSNREDENIYVIPVNVNLDTEHNMSIETVAVNSRNSATVVRQSNGVHPETVGYKQMADTVYYALKNIG
ncbi:MAG: SGNH/GDSL hydrolase family protein [Clostridiaceae bacterium]